MKIQDYLHLYIGCEGIAETIAKFKTRLVISNHTNDMRDGVDIEDAIQYNFKPILRPLSDMTEEEMDEITGGFTDIVPSEHFANYETWFCDIRETLDIKEVAELNRRLLAKQFDLFGLIPAGLAIDKTKEVAV